MAKHSSASARLESPHSTNPILKSGGEKPRELELSSQLEVDRLLDEKVERLTTLICQPGNEPFTTCVALLVLMSTISNSPHPKSLVTATKNFAFLHCCELNSSVVESQIAVFERELFSARHEF